MTEGMASVAGFSPCRITCLAMATGGSMCTTERPSTIPILIRGAN